MKTRHIFAIVGAMLFVHSAGAVAPLSQYGQIQNVQTYSTNPFYQNGVYNPKMPQAIYATGADLTTGDCQRTVDNLVASECATRNNCRGLRIADIRPTIMVKLSQLPGHNFATSCAGYIDSAFNSYTAKYGYNTSVATTFPTPTSAKNDTGFKMENPYKQKPTAAQQGVLDRTAELKELQKQTQTTPHAVVGGDFPKTMADVSFSDRIAVAQEGYEPYKDLNAFRTIKIESDEEFLERLRVINPAEYCRRVPNGSGCSVQAEADSSEDKEEQEAEKITTDDQMNALIAEMVEFMNPQTDAEKEFFTDLVTVCVKKRQKNPELWLDEQFVYNFLATNKRLDKYNKTLTGLTGVMESENYGIQVDWDEVLINISNLLDNVDKKHTLKVCENNRSWEVGIQVIMDAIAVVATVYTFGGATVALNAGRAALGTGLRALGRGVFKLGFKSAGTKLINKSATKFAAAGIKHITRGAVKEVAERAAKKIGTTLVTKRGFLLAAGLVGYGVGKNALKSSGTGVLYSLVSSDENKDILNCHDLDSNERCYTICGEGSGTDDLNTKVFQPILGKKYCVSRDDYNMYEILPTGGQGNVMVFEDNQFSKIRSGLKSIADSGNCDYNEDDIDAYFGYFIYDPDTMEISTEEMYIEDLVRIDD